MNDVPVNPTDHETATGPHAPARQKCLLVGMGASAGGIEAYSRFFDAMPANSGAAFIVVLHLDPNRESQMAQVLAVHTRMPVLQVEDLMAVQPNHVYVIAPDRDLTVRDGVLHMIKPAERRGHRHPVDVLFRSLAADQGERAIAVVLSGTGSNGTDGLKEVRAAGGLILVQDPATAKFDGMPRSVISAGLADHILPPEAMAAVLGRYFQDEYIVEPGGGESVVTEAQPIIDQILTVLRTRTGHNFGSYRRSTLQRRIQRRLGLRNLPSLDAYLAEVTSNPEEAPLLIKDLLINVTSFFRDADAWSTLCEDVIAPLVASRESGATIRAWVPACSTGEEAYTLAMLIAEQSSLAGKTFDVKIFATDAREDNLHHARDGIYPVAAVTGLNATRQRRFFDPSEATYRVKKDLRATVIFAPQNLLLDPPFSHMDLITCRNLLIYLESDAQQSIIALFHFALEQDGTLMLGNTETIGGHSGVFGPISKKWRIFRRLGPTRLDMVSFPVMRGMAVAPKPVQTRAAATPAPVEGAAAEMAKRALLERFAPAAVMVDAQSRVIYFHGPTSAFLEQPTGAPSRDLFAMARPGLGTKLRQAVRHVQANAGEVSFEVTLKHHDGHRNVTVITAPVAGSGDGTLLISFLPATLPAATPISDAADNPVQDAALRDELAAVRSELQSTIAHLEIANEDLKAANEEATSMNEELQSTNEELETSKEEMQSFNEELHTVNSQLQINVRDLENSTNDLNNLLAGTETATLFVDVNLCIKWFTPGTKGLFDFMTSDIGRPLQHFAMKFVDSTLLADVERVLQKLLVLETEVFATNGRWYLRRMLPYRTLENRIAGVVITFFDVTDSKMSRDASTEARIFSQAIVGTIRQPLLVMDDALTIVSVNPAFEALFTVDEAAATGKSVFDIAPGALKTPALRHLLDTLILDGHAFSDVEIDHQLPGLAPQQLMMNGRKLLREGGRPSLILLAMENVTDRRRGETDARNLAAIVDSSYDAIFSIDLNSTICSWNAGAVTIFGFSETEMIGQPISRLYDPASPDPAPDCLAQFRVGGENLHYEQPRLRKDGTSVWVSVTESPLRDAWGTLVGASGIARDMTERRKADQHREILVGELNHRVKNTLAIVQAIASQTLRGAIALPAARDAFVSRLMALARAHDLLINESWSGTDLASLVHATIEPHKGGPDRFTIHGPYVELNPSVAMTFSLAIHELCTNAAKYGALSVPEGTVEIAWTLTEQDDQCRLNWRWVERGGPAVSKPKHKGFGSSLIEQVLAMELFGKVSVTYPQDGLVCIVDAPRPA